MDRKKQPRGRGAGKGGRRKGQPWKDSRPVQEREGWQDPQVLRALHGDPPPGTWTQEEDSDAVVPHSGRQKRTEVEQQVPEKSKMIHTKKKKQPQNQQVVKALKAANRTKKAKKEVNAKGVVPLTNSVTGLREIKRYQKSSELLISEITIPAACQRSSWGCERESQRLPVASRCHYGPTRSIRSLPGPIVL